MIKKILLSLLFIGTLLNATAPTEKLVTKLYIATFDRIPDIDGLDYWVDESGLNLEQIAQSFFDQDETQQKYPISYTNNDFVDTIYQNLFAREPDATGASYWIGELNSGSISKNTFILAVMNGALDSDADILENKRVFATEFMDENQNLSSEEYTTKSKEEFDEYNQESDSLLDKLKDGLDGLIDKVEEEVERVQNQYQEYTGNEQDRGEKPFVTTFQETPILNATLVSSKCANNDALQYFAYMTHSQAQSSYFTDTSSLISTPENSRFKPFLDIRYFNNVSKYMNGGSYDYYPNHSIFTGLDTREGSSNIAIGTDASKVDSSGGIVQAECINGEVAVGVSINLFDAPEQDIPYGGPQSTLVYQLNQTAITSPWNGEQKGNLILQGYFDEPIYINHSENTGGSVSFGLFLHNKVSGKKLNFVIAIYAIGEAWIKEKAGIKFDPTTNIVHVATLIKDTSWWSTRSPSSNEMKEISSTPTKRATDDGVWNNLYRVNISYQNLLAVLDELQKNPPQGAEGVNFGMSPEDWEVSSIMLQYELEESGGMALLSGSFKGFEAYTSVDPI